MLNSKYIIYMYKNAIHITTTHTRTYIYIYIDIDDNTITIKWPHPKPTTQHEIANPNTNIPQITQTILNYINQPENEQRLWE
jgi:hypothetical protein